ncbi:MAG: hypothetical protein KatS3mg129_0243 [Leptospiraceae bacterium]|nr:MAG: hypothetical protein KatS3mg129_0243 [Leptospiraceae bacterium]
MDSIEILKLLDEYEVLKKPFQEIVDDFLESKKLLPVYLYENNLIKEKQLYKLNQVEFQLNKSKIYEFKNFIIYPKTYPKFFTSGDVFGIFPLKDNRVVITLSDVSGKGLEAGLLAFMLSYYINYELNMSSLTPQALLKKVNQLCLEIFDDLKFATFSIIVLDLLSGTIEYAGAGCPPILHYNFKEQMIEERDTVNIPLGIDEDFIYKGIKIDFNPGDVILSYTDGAFEQENRKGIPYGIERLKKALQKNATKPIKKIIRNLYWELRFYSIFKAPADDTTYIAIKYKKKQRHY